jgi:alpha-1,3-rhamnosyltransferase
LKTPLISILIPVYNHECYVEECIKSIWSQQCNDLEIIAIDDGSIDNSYNVLKSLKAISPVAMYTERQNNQGIVKTLNKALRLAHGDYVLCLASDDKLLGHALSPALKEIRQANLGFSIYNAKYFGDVNREVYSSKTAKIFHSDLSAILRQLYVEPPKPLLLQSTIIKRKIIDSIGGWNEEVTLDDWPMFIRLFEQVHSEKFSWLYDHKHFLSGYRIHGDNAHKNINKQIMMCEEVVRRYCPNHLKQEAYTNIYLDYALTLIRRMNLNGIALLHKGIDTSNFIMVLKLLIKKILGYTSQS